MTWLWGAWQPRHNSGSFRAACPEPGPNWVTYSSTPGTSTSSALKSSTLCLIQTSVSEEWIPTWHSQILAKLMQSTLSKPCYPWPAAWGHFVIQLSKKKKMNVLVSGAKHGLQPVENVENEPQHSSFNLQINWSRTDGDSTSQLLRVLTWRHALIFSHK